MRIIAITLLLALAFGAALAAPLQGSDINATVVLFGSSRMPVEDENSTQEILMVDVGLIGAENATYQLIDQNGNVSLPGLYRQLSSGVLKGSVNAKQTIYFLTEKDSLFKLINVTPDGEAPIYLNWWATPKASNARLILRYYGIVETQVNSNEQAVVMQVRVQNNGTQSLFVSPENFTLLDQWGWAYAPTLGFDPETVAPGAATWDRVLVGFTGISPISRPAALAYDYGAPDQIIIQFERDYVPLSNEVVYGSSAQNNTASAAAPTAAASTAASSETAVPLVQAEAASGQAGTAQTAQASASENTTTKVSSIKDKVAASQARLAAMKLDLDKKTPESDEAASSSGSALNNSSSISA
jgi:hypothetical protein